MSAQARLRRLAPSSSDRLDVFQEPAMNLARCTFPAICAASLLSACASITDGTTQTVVFHLTPTDARCVVSRDGEQLGTVNGKQNTITIGKGAKDVLVNCSAEGYENATHRLISKTQTSGVVGGFFIDLGITDMITGAMWKYPNDISIVLEKSQVATKDTKDTKDTRTARRS
jgi:hypothetical protein